MTKLQICLVGIKLSSKFGIDFVVVMLKTSEY